VKAPEKRERGASDQSCESSVKRPEHTTGGLGHQKAQNHGKTRWWQLKYGLIFTPKIGENSHFDQYFSDGLKPPTM